MPRVNIVEKFRDWKLSHTTFIAYRKGILYFRILGYGLWWATYASARTYFSERNEHRKPILKTKTWRVFVLTP